jgi:transcriptional regulator GlxA family with amidase domain
MRERFTDLVSEAELTAHVGMSARQLQRMFKAKLNASFRSLLMKMRVHKACDLLRLGERNLAEISSECGFYDQSSFSRHFRKLMGMTPRQYRKRW